VEDGRCDSSTASLIEQFFASSALQLWGGEDKSEEEDLMDVDGVDEKEVKGLDGGDEKEVWDPISEWWRFDASGEEMVKKIRKVMQLNILESNVYCFSLVCFV